MFIHQEIQGVEYNDFEKTQKISHLEINDTVENYTSAVTAKFTDAVADTSSFTSNNLIYDGGYTVGQNDNGACFIRTDQHANADLVYGVD